LVRRAGPERGPDLAEPEPARLARRYLADRPRRGALLPPRLAQAGRPGQALRHKPARAPRPGHDAGPGARQARAAGHGGRARRGDRRRPGGVVRRPGRRRLRRVSAAPGPAGSGGDPPMTPPPPAPVAPVPPGAEVFEYALIRVMPRVERGEAINAGVIVYARAFRYLRTKIELNEARLLALDPAADLAAVRAALSA